MENISEWDLITSCLAMCDITRTRETWGFLVHLRLVSNTPDNLSFFVAECDRQKAIGVITGPSVGYRIGSALKEREICLPRALDPDPSGRLAQVFKAEYDAGTIL